MLVDWQASLFELHPQAMAFECPATKKEASQVLDKGWRKIA
jgi:hypothetical protein